MSAGGEIASTFDSPDKLKLGSCKLIEEIMIGEDKLIHFSGVEMGEACTIVLRGASALLSLPSPCLLHRLVCMACTNLMEQMLSAQIGLPTASAWALPACLPPTASTCLFDRECAPVKLQAGLLRLQYAVSMGLVLALLEAVPLMSTLNCVSLCNQAGPAVMSVLLD